MEDIDKVSTLATNKDEHFKVNVKSKRVVAYQLSKYKSLLKNLLDGQCQLPEDDKKKLLQEILTNFQLAVQENIVIDGLSWEEAPEEDGEDIECSELDDALDEKIVQTTWKRSMYPKKILPYVVRCLKAERKLMGLFENGIKPQEVKRDAVQDASMNNLSVAALGTFKQASTVLKSLKALQETAEGLKQVLDAPLSAPSLEAYREVLGATRGPTCPAVRQPADRRIIKRAVSETEYSMDYIPVLKIPATSADGV
ncbi:kinetochore-associated protein NSL1 homolog [Brachyhypopomus gauderio]|uniref:kinetochore-associated protein NSL1 homolog n=1 Tax=Brachyhypopomus gauderio TaxID=698409 RepID=UPI00404338F7